MSEQVYDCMLILDSNRYARDAGGVAARIKQILESHGATVLVSRLWEERRLAYPIAGQRKGTYWLTFFRANTQQVAKIERDFQLSEDVLRSLPLKVNPRIAESLVAHHLAEHPAEPRQPRSEPRGEPRGERREAAGVGEER